MSERLYGVIVCGVGGQGAITVAQLVLGAAWRGGYKTLQSEVHGMSQRGGSVNAQILFSKEEVTSPILMEGTGDVLVGIEPLETLRYLPLLKEDALVVSSLTPVINMAGYPDPDAVIEEVKSVDGVVTVETDKVAKELKNPHAGNIVLLGIAAKKMPFTLEHWESVIAERFQAKGEVVINKNIEAFKYGFNS